ncbi:MAG: DUF2442 domain-containing protein [Candidatus Kapabacteria bacterium]|jgi:hypothetical protein|nr:DUF2442 domain-containing protein [Candidatus Kapabacteria bacterium]
MFLHITSVRLCGEYVIECTFNTNETLRVNLQNELYGEVFTPLLDKQRFAEARINPDTKTVEWDNGADFAPEFLYELAQEQSSFQETTI